MDSVLSRLRLEIQNIFRTESGNQAKVSFMTAYRFTEAKINMPQTEKPYLYLVLDGTASGFIRRRESWTICPDNTPYPK